MRGALTGTATLAWTKQEALYKEGFLQMCLRGQGGITQVGEWGSYVPSWGSNEQKDKVEGGWNLGHALETRR